MLCNNISGDANLAILSYREVGYCCKVHQVKDKQNDHRYQSQILLKTPKAIYRQ